MGCGTMNFEIERADFLKALGHVQSVVEKRNTLPILANVMIAAKEGAVVLTATDMEIALTETLPVPVKEAGATTVPAAPLYEIVRKLPDGSTITISHRGGTEPLSLKAGRFATTLNVLPVEEFPQLAAGTLPVRFELAASLLKGMIDRTRFAISNEETRYYLNGIYFHAAETPDGLRLRAVATDGHRLAQVEEVIPEGAERMPGVIVPRKAVNEVRKLLDEGAVKVSIALSETRIQFRVGGTELTSKLIDGTFPEYERVIPRQNDKVLRVAKKDFAEAVGRVAAISVERMRPVKLSLSRGLLVLSAMSPDLGTASEELDGERVHYEAAPIEIGFQARYITDITDQIEGEVEFLFADSSAPTLVRDAADLSALYVLMPMRV